MKKIVNKLRFALLLGFVAMSVTAWSQAVPYINKMSITTQMFLDDLSSNSPMLKAKAAGQSVVWDRLYAAPETRDGKTYIAAFVRVNDANTIRELESRGVEVQSQFKNGTLLSTAIPVDALDELTALEGVTRVNVSPVVQLETKQARQATNADDVLTLSSDAQTAGLTTAFDGTGVILGVIDTGIDFNHTAFKDANGNSRVKRAYIYTGSSGHEYTSVSGLTTDNTGSDHGTHTSSIAGGSSVTGSYSYTVTTDHANATYGGMAPGADLYLAGASTTVTGIANAFSLMQQYAQSEGKPLVVNNSWSMPYGPHDGTGDFADVVNDIFNDNNPGFICLFASANNANLSSSSDNGGFFVTGTATSSSPLGTIMRNETYAGRSYSGYIADAWCRTPGLDMGCTVYVLNNSTGAILATVPVNFGSTGTTGTTVNVSSYYSGTLTAYKDYVSTSNGKTEILLEASSLSTSSSSYTLAVEFYPTSGSSIIDVWAGSSSSYLSGHLTTSGHTWTSGTDDMSVNNTATLNNVISVGSYVTRTQSGSNSVGDISDFSGYATANYGPQGVAYPWITAPGEVIYSALNTQSGSSSYGGLSGTSQATPVATGIVAQWLQAAKSVGKTLTTSEVKNIMAQTAVKDSYVTSGSNASHFGPNGKIDALAGVQYILDNYATGVAILPSLTGTVSFNNPSSQTITVNGRNLTGNITASLNDETGAFSITKASAATLRAITSLTLSAGEDIVVAYAPSAAGTHTATLTLSSNGADDVVITLSGTATASGGGGGSQDYLVCEGTSNAYLPIYGTWYDANQVNQMLYPSTVLDASMSGKTITSMTFYPKSGIAFREGTITFKLANMTSGTAAYTSSPTRKEGDFQIVKTVSLPSTAQTNLTEWVIDFDNYFTYTGGDLLIEVETTAGQYGNSYFNGASVGSYYGYYSYNSITSAQTTLPQVTFAAGSAGTAAPKFSLEAGTYEGAQNVTITSSTLGATIYYTTDGTTPTTSSASISNGGTVTISQSCTLTAIAVVDGESSTSTSAAYVIEALVPSLTVDPTEVSIEDATGDARTSEAVTVTSVNQSGDFSTSASTNWTASLAQDNASMTLTYNGYALHQEGRGSVTRDGITANVDGEYLYTGPIYVIGDVNGYAWNTSNGVQLTRDENGIYTGSISTQQSSDAAYILFTKRLGDDTNYRFGPVSNGNWWLTSETTDVYCDLDTVGNLNNMRLAAGNYVVTIDSRNNQFKIREAIVSSSVTPTEVTIDFGSVATGNSTTQTITITNDGDIAFTPSLNGLGGSFSTDYVPSELAPGESVTITITYSPSNAGSDSQSFSVSDGVNTHTWTLVGAATAPTTHGYVDSEDQNIAFGERALDQTYTDKVRIYNDGDVAIEPVIDVTGMNSVFTVTPTTGITIQPGKYYDLTVYFHPTEVTSYSSTFTVTINGESTTVTVTGSGNEATVVDNVVRSNTVTVPVYKTGIDVLSPFTIEAIDADLDHSMPVDVTNSDVMVKVARPTAITRYDVYHHEDTKEDESNWAPGSISDAVAYANHDRLAGSYLPFVKDQETWTNWVEQPVAPWTDTEASNMWLHLNDYVEVQGHDTWYVPVVVANGKVSKDNTYGAPMLASPLCQVTAVVSYDESDVMKDEQNNNAEYYYLTAQMEMTCTAPVAPENATYHYECYKARAWRVWTPYIIGVGAQPQTETYMGEVSLDGAQDVAVIGNKDFERDDNGKWITDEPVCCVPAGTTPTFIGRFYYVRVDNATGATLRSGGGGGGGGGGAGAAGDGPMPPEDPTDVVSVFTNGKTVVDVTYVNTLGMTSDYPFEGVNIVVTRYNDGTISTVKVIK